MTEALAAQVAQLKTLRTQLDDADALVKERQIIMNANHDYQTLLNAKVAKQQLEEKIAAAEGETRTQAVAVFRATNSKEPVPGIIIKLFTVLKYDKAVAEEWARVHAPAVFKFDAKAFEKVAVTLGAPVEAVEEPRAQIASKLE
jgi:hypothetical protein